MRHLRSEIACVGDIPCLSFYAFPKVAHRAMWSGLVYRLCTKGTGCLLALRQIEQTDMGAGDRQNGAPYERQTVRVCVCVCVADNPPPEKQGDNSDVQAPFGALYH